MELPIQDSMYASDTMYSNPTDDPQKVFEEPYVRAHISGSVHAAHSAKPLLSGNHLIFIIAIQYCARSL